MAIPKKHLPSLDTPNERYIGMLSTVDLFRDQFRELLANVKGRERKIQILERAVKALSEVTASGNEINLEQILNKQLRIALELCDMREDGKGLIQLVENLTNGGRELVVHSHYGQKITGRDLERLPLGLPADVEKLRGITAIVATLGESILIEDVQKDPRRRQFVWIIKDTRSSLTVPLKVGKTTIGVLDLEHASPGAFNTEHRYWVEVLAQLISITIHAIFQYKQLKAFRNLLTLTTQKTDLKGIIPAVNKAITQITGAETIIIFTLHPRDETLLVLKEDYEIRKGGVPVHDKLEVRIGEGVTGRAAALRRHVYIEDVRKVGKIRQGNIVDGHGQVLYRQYLKETMANWGEPLIAGKDLIGVLNLESPRPNAFDALSPDVMKIIASGISMALQQSGYMISINKYAGLLLEADTIFRQQYVLDKLNKFHELAGREMIGDITELLRACPEIRKNAEAMRIVSGLTRTVDELSKDTKGLAQLTLAEAGLETTLERSLNYVLSKGKLKNIIQHRQYSKAVGSIPVKGRLDLILQNLLGNVIEHAQGNVWIKAELYPESVHFSIKDDGPGIPQEKQSSVFEFGVTGGRNKRGAGMGLSIANWCVRGANGQASEIMIESTPGKGSTFSFSLPRLRPGPTHRNSRLDRE
jgi:putative methionine-R-sulfoxide reductase with GAF domain